MIGKNSEFPLIIYLMKSGEPVLWSGGYSVLIYHEKATFGITYTFIHMKVNYLYWRCPDILYFTNQLRIFINRKEKFSGSFPPTAVPAQQILAFSEQKSTPNWKMPTELVLPESQVSCTFQIFQAAWMWPCLCFSLLPKTHSAQQVFWAELASDVLYTARLATVGIGHLPSLFTDLFSFFSATHFSSLNFIHLISVTDLPCNSEMSDNTISVLANTELKPILFFRVCWHLKMWLCIFPKKNGNYWPLLRRSSTMK